MRNLIFLVLLLALFSGCSKKTSDETQARQSQAAVKVDPATAATISGVVKFDGPLPKPQKIDMSQDPACGAKTAFDESLVVNNGDLANVFVYVKDGPAVGFTGAVPVIVQKGCRYEPHVIGMEAGSSLKIVNADETTHNIHPMPSSNKQWNESQLPKGEPIIKTFKQPEIMIPVQCNQHPWMKMFVNVVNNPFFAVSGPDGKFEIHGLPPGKYTLAAVHEKLGAQDVKISVGPKESQTADFTFKAK